MVATMRRILLIGLSVVASLFGAAPAFAGVDFNHNETFLQDES
jgi:hypothetical protein